MKENFDKEIIAFLNQQRGNNISHYEIEEVLKTDLFFHSDVKPNGTKTEGWVKLGQLLKDFKAHILSSQSTTAPSLHFVVNIKESENIVEVRRISDNKLFKISSNHDLGNSILGTTIPVTDVFNNVVDKKSALIERFESDMIHVRFKVYDDSKVGEENRIIGYFKYPLNDFERIATDSTLIKKLEVKHKIFPDEMRREYVKREKSFKNFDEFFDEYAEGRRVGSGIASRYLGYANDVTLFWRDEEEYPFAYVFPATMNKDFETGYFFYIRASVKSNFKN
jgi:hypothetical protein